jgi:CheY-like chemotaxis protein
MNYTIQTDWKVLVLEDTEERISWFKKRVPNAVYCATAADAIRELSLQDFQVVFLDHDLHWMHAADNTIVQGTEKQVALHLKKTGFHGIVVIHSKNENGVEVMRRIRRPRRLRGLESLKFRALESLLNRACVCRAVM